MVWEQFRDLTVPRITLEVTELKRNGDETDAFEVPWDATEKKTGEGGGVGIWRRRNSGVTATKPTRSRCEPNARGMRGLN